MEQNKIEQRQNFDIPESDIAYVKKTIPEIRSDMDTIDPSKVAKEIITWIINNVENFIDNQSKTFKLDLVVDGSEVMKETKRLQDLYRAIPDDEGCTVQEIDDAQLLRRALDELVEAVFQNMQDRKSALKKLFIKMKYYYEKLIPDADHKKRAIEIDEELKAVVKLQSQTSSEKESRELKIKALTLIDEGKSLINYEDLHGSVSIINFEYDAFSVGVKVGAKDGKEAQQYTIPEGFAVWLRISLMQKPIQTALF